MFSTSVSVGYIRYNFKLLVLGYYYFRNLNMIRVEYIWASRGCFVLVDTKHSQCVNSILMCFNVSMILYYVVYLYIYIYSRKYIYYGNYGSLVIPVMLLCSEF